MADRHWSRRHGEDGRPEAHVFHTQKPSAPQESPEPDAQHLEWRCPDSVQTGG